MIKRLFSIAALLLGLSAVAGASEFNEIPFLWKWVSNERVVFTYDGSFNDDRAFAVDTRYYEVVEGVKAPARYAQMPLSPEGAVNRRYSPDSTMIAFTRENDLWVADIATGAEKRLTFDGSDLILNGYASWVYYEEILGRASQYCAFWWSPDSKKLGFYRFDNSQVPMFPIYSPVGQDGKLSRTRYPKAGEPNPEVQIGMVDISSAFTSADWAPNVVWADFDPKEDQYFGIPFWSGDSKYFYIAREPRLQHDLNLYAVSAEDGSKTEVYSEHYDTWLDWIEKVIFTDKGLYMARSFETGYEQIYFLSYDGKTLRRLTDGHNLNITLIRVDGDDVYFSATRDVFAKQAVYKVNAKGQIFTLTDPSLNAQLVSFSPDGKHFVASLSSFDTPTQIWIYETDRAERAWKTRKLLASAESKKKRIDQRYARTCFRVADRKGDDYDPSKYALPQLITLNTEEGFELPAQIVYPKNFDPSKKYPVHFEIYGGPGTASVRDRWITPNENNQWWSEHGIINIVADSRVAGHHGRRGTDEDFRNLTAAPVKDFVAWGEYMKSLPYVDGDKIGVEGFSFGGSMTALLLFEHSDVFHYGIAGGGVYDWMLYDSHYTERFMETPQANPEGYAASRVMSSVSSYPVTYENNDGSVMLKLTHGTGDDNVHFQNTLQLVDELQKQGKCFELMIYPDGMHGYRGAQGRHSAAADRDFWLKYLIR
jgi:dipeptidyl-peptidase 4